MRTTEVLLSEKQGAEQQRAVPFSARRVCVSRPAHSDAGRRRDFQHDPEATSNYGIDHLSLEGALPSVADGWTGYASSGPVGQRADAGLESHDSVFNA